MAVENGIQGDNVTMGEEASATSTSKGAEDQKVKGDERTQTVPFHKLFSFADKIDILLMIVGTIGAIGNGISMPLMTILFGDLVDSFGQNQNNGDVVEVVSKVTLWILQSFMK